MKIDETLALEMFDLIRVWFSVIISGVDVLQSTRLIELQSSGEMAQYCAAILQTDIYQFLLEFWFQGQL